MRKTAAALCALMIATPAWAQQDALRADRPPSAVDSGERALSPQVRQALAALSRNTVAAQQFGNLAASKQTPSDIRELGDRMVAVNSEINDRLDQIDARYGLDLPERMAPQHENYFEALADTNSEEFARGLVAWVDEVYPQSIRALQTAARDSGLEDLAQRAVPSLRDQLQASRQFAQALDQGGTLQATVPERREGERSRGAQ